MLIRKTILITCFVFVCSAFCKAQIEVEHVSMKEFKATGFGGFLNFSFPVSDANYVTAELGAQYFSDKYDEEVIMLPVLAGYRYTVNQSGTGLYSNRMQVIVSAQQLYRHMTKTVQYWMRAATG